MSSVFKDTENTTKCWEHIGVWGNKTCKELEVHIHCKNCPVFSKAGRQLFSRERSGGQIIEVFNQKKENEKNEKNLSVFLFRVGKQWYALPAERMIEIASDSKIHTLPMMQNPVVKGIVNIRGQIKVLFDLHKIIKEHFQATSKHNIPRIILTGSGKDEYAFRVDEAWGVWKVAESALQKPPKIYQSESSLVNYVLTWQEKDVALLNYELLSATITKLLK